MSTNVVKTEKRSNRKPDKKAAGKATTVKSKKGAAPEAKKTTGNPFVDLTGKYKDEPLWDDFIEAIRKNRIKDRRNFKD